MHPDRDALVVGMTVVPALFSRNRMFAFFERPEVRWARARAAELRGAVRHLRGGSGEVEVLEFSRGVEVERGVLHYRVAQLRLSRRMELNATEAACVAYLCFRAGSHVVPMREGDRALVDDALHRLACGVRLAGLESGLT